MYLLPRQVSAVFMHVHLARLEVVQLFPDGSFVFGCQPCPGLVRPTLVVGTGSHLDVVVKFDNLKEGYLGMVF